jgi:hypothetical protein
MADTPDKDSTNSINIEHQSEEKHQDTSPILRAELQIPHSVTDACHSEQKRKYRLEWWKFCVEILTLLAITAYAVIAYHQWGAMKDAADATKKSADATTKAVQIAENTLKANIEISRRDQRAWVGVIAVEPPVLKDPNNNPVYVKEGLPAKFGVVISNFGKSPALKVKPAINAYLLAADAKLSPGYGIGERRSIGVIQPQARGTLPTNPTPTIFNASHINDMKSGKLILYLFGMITYEDVFKEPHCTTFCMFLSPSLNAFMTCNTYNQAD